MQMMSEETTTMEPEVAPEAIGPDDTGLPSEEPTADVLAFPGDKEEVPPIAESVDQVVKEAVQANGSTLSPKYSQPIPPELETVHPDILAANARVDEAESDWKAKKKIAKAAKEEWEEAIADLRKVIKEIRQPSLFNQPREDKRLDPPKPAPASSSATVSGVTKPEDTDDSWRGDLIEVLKDHGLKDSIIAKLHDGGNIYTIGDLSDFTDPAKNGGNPHKRITEIKGIGAGKAKDIEEAMTSYWKKRDNDRFDREQAAKEEAETAAKVEALLEKPEDEAPADAVAAEAEDQAAGF